MARSGVHGVSPNFLGIPEMDIPNQNVKSNEGVMSEKKDGYRVLIACTGSVASIKLPALIKDIESLFSKVRAILT